MTRVSRPQALDILLPRLAGEEEEVSKASELTEATLDELAGP